MTTYLDLLPIELNEFIWLLVHRDRYRAVLRELVWIQSIPYIAEVFVNNIMETVLANIEL